VQAVLTGLFSEPHPEPLPLLLLLPGGTTNMIAIDIGVRKERPVATLARFLADAREGRVPATVVRRPVIRMQRGAEDPIFGMFFGCGAIYHGINFCRRWLYKVGLKGEIGPGVAMAVFIMKAMLGNRSEVMPPINASGQIDGVPFESKEYHGVMASTLGHLFLGIRPFWGSGDGPLKFTRFSDPLSHGLSAASAILRGKANDAVRPENGYESCTAHTIELQIDGGFTLDGELFDPQPGVPVSLNGDSTVSFLRLDGA
jgi:diacylglycerol kinase family enzyme